MRRLVFTIENLGTDDAINRAVFESFHKNSITSASIVANGEAFKDAVKNVAKTCTTLDIGINLNLSTGKALSHKNISALTALDGYFDKNYLQLFMLSTKQNFLEQVEIEFRSQVERVIDSGIKPTFFASVNHIHTIPNIFKIVCKLAKEYGIPFVRTHSERFYITPGAIRVFSTQYFCNVFKNLLFKFLNIFNLRTLKKYQLLTNKRFIGILYSMQMDIETVLFGINSLGPNENAEIIFNATSNKWKPHNYLEFKTLLHPDLLKEVLELNAELTNINEFTETKEENSENIETETGTILQPDIDTSNDNKPTYYVESDEFDTIVHTETLAKILSEEKLEKTRF